MRLIKPWVGKHYADGLNGKKILVVGESHYSEEGDFSEDFTIEVIKRYCNVEPDSWPGESKVFFTKIATLLLQKKSAAEFSWCQLGELYNQIAFCNFLQGLAGNSPYDWAEDELYSASIEPFREIVSDLAPDIVVVNSTAILKKYFPDVGVKTIWIDHMSRGGYGPARRAINQIWD